MPQGLNRRKDLKEGSFLSRDSQESTLKPHIFALRLSHTQIIALGFLLLIFTGALLLSLPIASVGKPVSFFDALFTSTSASCVTGLIVVNTGAQWTLFGQIVLLILIQIGGLGFMTLVTFFLIVMRRKVGLQERQIMTESINASSIGGILSITKVILLGTLLFEGTGAIILAVRFITGYGFSVGEGIWYGIFHSVSAFCNAGFDIMGKDGFSNSLMRFSADPVVNIVIILLIIIGGLGFLVWEDIRVHGFRWKRYRLQTKAVLFMTAVLVVTGAVLIFIFEKGATGKDMGVGERILTALFTSVTTRTAGFNTVDTGAMSASSLVLCYMLMFIGGNSGSTAGGVKTTSVLVVLVFAISGIRRKPDANVFGRRIHEDALKQSIYVISFNLMLAIVGALVIGAIQPELGIDKILFEVFSAIGTVGMTMGITSQLLPVGKLAIMLLMYLGRVGSVSFGLAMLERKARPAVTYPTESITVG